MAIPPRTKLEITFRLLAVGASVLSIVNRAREQNYSASR
jgi:hypothetical protein